MIIICLSKMIELTYIIRSIIKKYFREGRAGELKNAGIEEIKASVKQSGGLWKDYKGLIYKLTKDVEKELGKQFVEERTNPTKDSVKEKLNQNIALFENKLESRQREIFNTIQKSIENSVGQKKDWKTIARESLRKIGLEDHHIQTEVETTKAALNNITRLEQFKNAGVKFLRYEGPASERNFCMSHLGKVYLLSEVEKMANDFGQPAYSFCGGYNCRHRWVPMKGETDPSSPNLFIENSFTERYNAVGKNEKKVLTKELETAKKLSSLGYKVELNYGFTSTRDKDTDIIFEGKQTQIKSKSTNNQRALERALQDAKNQSDIIIIDLQVANKDIQNAESKAKRWIMSHQNKKAFYIYNNKLKEIK